MLDNCFRFAPRDSIPGLIAKICKYLKDHPGWSEGELEEQIKKFISADGVESFNGRIGNVTLDKNDVNNLKIASAYFAEGDESIDSLDLVSLYNQGIRFVFTDFNSVTSGYNLAFVLDYFDASGEVVYYPVSTGSGGGGNIVSVNGKTGEVHLKVVDVSNGNSPDENAYIFIDESDDYPDVISSDSSKLGGQLPSYYASAEEVSQLKDDKLDKPMDSPQVGKILRIKAVNDDGTFVCVWSDYPSSAVNDVKVNGTSIVYDGVADIPMGTMSSYGLVKGHENLYRAGVQIDAYGVRLSSTDDSRLNSRIKNSGNYSAPIQERSLDMSVRHAMCDGIGDAWTDVERIAALLRMGCTVDDNGFVKWTAQEV